MPSPQPLAHCGGRGAFGLDGFPSLVGRGAFGLVVPSRSRLFILTALPQSSTMQIE